MGATNTKPRVEIKQRTYRYALDLLKFLDKLDKLDWTVQVISKQLLRCGTSIGANIIEAQAGSTRKDFTNFITHSLKSANESKFWICLLRDSGKGDRVIRDNLLSETVEIANILAASVITLKNKIK